MQIPSKNTDFVIVKAEVATGAINQQWSFGGNFYEVATGTDIDTDGFIYVTGTSNSDGLTHGFNDIFTFKFNP